MRARDIIRAEYGGSRNFMTPDVIKVGKRGPLRAYELSSGQGLMLRGLVAMDTPVGGRIIYGVSVVDVTPAGTVRRSDLSDMFDSLQSAEDYIETLGGLV